MDMILICIMAGAVGVCIGCIIKSYNKVEAKDYDILLNKYESLKTELNEKVYIGATYTNGYIDLIVSDCSDYAVWFSPSHNDIKIEKIAKDIFNKQFRLKENERN